MSPHVSECEVGHLCVCVCVCVCVLCVLCVCVEESTREERERECCEGESEVGCVCMYAC